MPERIKAAIASSIDTADGVRPVMVPQERFATIAATTTALVKIAGLGWQHHGRDTD
jgi:hypothetical protein